MTEKAQGHLIISFVKSFIRIVFCLPILFNYIQSNLGYIEFTFKTLTFGTIIAIVGLVAAEIFGVFEELADKR